MFNKTFMAVINYVLSKAKETVTVSIFYPSLLFVVAAKSLPFRVESR